MKVHGRKEIDETFATMFSNPTYSSSYLFYACMVGQCQVQIREDLPAPAGVSYKHDKYILFINPNEFANFSIEQRLGIIKHEMLHILNGHLNGRLENAIESKKVQDGNLITDRSVQQNYAFDCAINQMINQDHLPRITEEDLKDIPLEIQQEKNIKVGDTAAIYPSTFPVQPCPEGKESEFYYEMLKNEEEEDQDKDCSKCNGEGETEDENGETHTCDRCNGSGKEPNSEMKQGSGKMVGDHGTWQESEGDSDLQKDITKKMIEKSIEQTEKSRGDIPSEISQYLKLFSRNAQVSWKRVLKNITGNKKANTRRTIMRADRRFPKREDLRGKTKDRTFQLLVVSDVSGSVNDEALLSLLQEVKHICDITKTDLDLIQVDTHPSEPEKLSKRTKIIDRKAAGGTYLSPALDKAKDNNIKYDAVVVTTDGYLDTSDVNKINTCGKKVIWLIEEQGKIMQEMSSAKSQAFQIENGEA